MGAGRWAGGACVSVCGVWRGAGSARPLLTALPDASSHGAILRLSVALPWFRIANRPWGLSREGRGFSVHADGAGRVGRAAHAHAPSPAARPLSASARRRRAPAGSAALAGCGCAPGSGAFSLARSSTTYLARHLPPISLSAPAPRSPARRRRRRCHPPSRPRRWPPAPRRHLRGSRAIGRSSGLPAPALRVRRSALPSPLTRYPS